ncbi:MAG: hypothetical protein PWQ86_179 [Bacillota bacterium]|nr:hypothetical protein [Bacillota bacterium]
MNSENTYRLSWREIKKDWPLWLIIAGTFLLGLYLAPRLPEQVPSHWNLRGEVDGYASRTFAVFFQPMLTAGLYLLFLVLPLIDPRRANYARFAGTYRFLKALLVLFMCLLQLAILGTALGYISGPTWFFRLGLPLLFILLGNVMGQIRYNYFVGIKTPWTLASEEVWQKTHRAAARIWVVAGLAGAAAAFLPAAVGTPLLLIALTAAGIIPVVHSYLLWRRLN